MSVGLIIFFILIGLLFLVVEILITPGIVLGIIGLGFISFGVYQTYQHYGSFVGNITLFAVGVITIGGVLLALKTGVWTRIASKDAIESKAKEDVSEIAIVGDLGKALSALRPTGTALLNGRKVEVVTQGEAVESGAEIEVIRIERNKIYIKKT